MKKCEYVCPKCSKRWVDSKEFKQEQVITCVCSECVSNDMARAKQETKDEN